MFHSYNRTKLELKLYLFYTWFYTHTLTIAPSWNWNEKADSLGRYASSYNRTKLELKCLNAFIGIYEQWLTIAPSWNWNYKEGDTRDTVNCLQSHQAGIEIEQYQAVWTILQLLTIAPSWNWNNIWEAWLKFHPTYNRTKLELKLYLVKTDFLRYCLQSHQAGIEILMQ